MILMAGSTQIPCSRDWSGVILVTATFIGPDSRFCMSKMLILDRPAFLFVQCLEEIQSWSEAHPTHLPLLVLINAKQAPIDLPGAVEPLEFDHAAFDALDSEIRAVIGPKQLLTPDDVRGDAATLRDAVLENGWSSLAETRGKIFFALDEGPIVVEIYRRGKSALQGHAMFVNAPDELSDDAAYFTMNDPVATGELITSRVQKGFIVRTRADANTIEARSGDRERLNAALVSGAQYISTDYYLPRKEWSTYLASMPNGEMQRANPHGACAYP